MNAATEGTEPTGSPEPTAASGSPGPTAATGGVAVRVIPCLDVSGGRVVKGVNFLDLQDAGDPV